MYKFFIILVFSFLVFKTFPQNTYEYYYSTPYNELSRSIIEDEEGNVYFPIENFEFGLIIKLDPVGNFLDSIKILNSSGTCNISELIPKDSSHFIALGHWSTDTTNELWYLVLDNDLQIVDDKKIYSENNIVYDFKYIINHNGNIVFTALYQPDVTSFFDVCLWELTFPGDVVRHRFFDHGNSYNANYSILENPWDSTYKVFTRFNMQNRISCVLNILDSNFNFIDDPIWFGSNIGFHNTAKWIDDSTYLLSGEKVDVNTGDYNLGILKLTEKDSILDSRYIGSNDTIDWPGLYKNLDWLSFENIFFAGTINSYWFPFQTEPSWIILNMMDTGLNIKSQQIYGGDAYYLVNCLIATRDSGCIMTCTRYDWTKPDKEFDVYILKVNKDGLLTGTNDLTALGLEDILVSPNPSAGRVVFQFPGVSQLKHKQLLIINTLGTVVLKTEIPGKTDRLPMDLSFLPSGLYFASILSNGNRVATGKFIIERMSD